MASDRLASATSPYLRQHAANPVDWYAWGEEAFARARERDCPIFLSVGYFTCHWCHVMERESFASAELAAQLNRDFVSIKLDREERPDIDRLYMSYVQSSTGAGGWPMSVFLTPDLKPFYGGTYFPPQPRHGLPGFRQLLAVLAQAWRDERPRLLQAAEHARQFLAQASAPAPAAPGGDADEAVAARLVRQVWPRLWRELRDGFDAHEGGFGGAPKFPRPAALGFLLRYARFHPHDADEATAMVRRTLEAMAHGGIHDQLGGGFHRYATDAGWRVPHFEKMLYDQAQLAVAYLEAWQATGDGAFATVVRSTCDYVLRDLTSPEGLFYCAQDADSLAPGALADSEAREGAFYLWSWSEIEAVVGSGAAAFAAVYGAQEHGNVPQRLDPQGEFSGTNILYRAQPPPPDQAAALAGARQLLLARRRQRPHPPLDDKTLTAWNALMITALARAGAALPARAAAGVAAGAGAELDAAGYLAAATRAATALLTSRWEPAAGRLLRTDGVEGFAEDYAFLIQALLDLHQANFDPAWLAAARALQQAMEARFAAPGGGYYATASPDALGLRRRDEYDGAEPTANSVALGNLLRLADLAEGDAEASYRVCAARLLASFAAPLEAAPQALAAMAGGLESAAAPPRTLRFAGPPDAAPASAMARTVRARFLPGYTLVPAPGDGPAQVIACSGMRCELPVTGLAALAALLDGLTHGTTLQQ